MAFSEKSFIRVTQVPIGTAAGGTRSAQSSRFEYASDDAAATVETAGYFNTVRDRLTVGDVIRSVMAAAGTPVLKHYVVLTVPTTGNVTIGLQTTTAG